MKTAWKIVIIIAVLIIIALAVARIATGEDSCICEDGNWIKHGFPSSENPQEPCKEKFIQKILFPSAFFLSQQPLFLKPYRK